MGLLKKSRYIELSVEIEQVDRSLSVLDSSNPIEQERIALLHLKLDELSKRIRLYEKESRLSKFQIIQGGLHEKETSS